MNKNKTMLAFQLGSILCRRWESKYWSFPRFVHTCPRSVILTPLSSHSERNLEQNRTKQIKEAKRETRFSGCRIEPTTIISRERSVAFPPVVRLYPMCCSLGECLKYFLFASTLLFAVLSSVFKYNYFQECNGDWGKR